MILEQLAGDELDNPTRETITATGYYRLGIWDDEPADPLQSTYDGYDDILKTTSEVFMGMTVACARCHSHKIDPIPMKDYYGLLGFFHNIKPYSRAKEHITANVISKDRLNEINKQNAKLNELRRPILAEIASIEKDLAKKTNSQAPSISDLKYKFYRSSWDELPDFDMIRPEEEGTLPNGFFDISNASRKTAFGYVFEGKLIVPKNAIYSFSLNSDDGSRLSINGKSILEFDGIHSLAKKPQTGKTSLVAGEHKIRLEYFQNVGSLGLEVTWSGPDFTDRPLSKN